jgi:hypothetical protein
MQPAASTTTSGEDPGTRATPFFSSLKFKKFKCKHFNFLKKYHDVGNVALYYSVNF